MREINNKSSKKSRKNKMEKVRDISIEEKELLKKNIELKKKLAAIKVEIKIYKILLYKNNNNKSG